MSEAPRPKTLPLSVAQERRLMVFLEERFLDVARNFKKRSDPSTTVPNLSSYLKATHTLLSLVLQIPPLDPSTSLRTALLLRLTGEVMECIPGYKPDTETLQTLLNWLNELDRAWLAVLRSQLWDLEAREGVDLILDADSKDGSSGSSPSSGKQLRSSPMTQTERTRLRSLLVTGTTNLEEWLVKLVPEGQEYQAVLEQVGLQQGFDDLFSGTLAEMGTLNVGADIPNDMEC